MAAQSPVCSVLGAVIGPTAAVLEYLLRKQAQLQSLANTILQAGQTIPLPDISGLIPISQVNYTFYNNLANSCPFLNLPSAYPNALTNLQAQVINGYNNLLNQINQHPWALLQQLDDEMEQALQKAFTGLTNDVLNPLGEILLCLQSLCATSDAVTSGQFIQSNVAAYQAFANGSQGTPAGYSAVLNGSMMQAQSTVNTAQNQLKTLLTT